MTPDLSYNWEGAGEQCDDNKWDREKKKNVWARIKSFFWTRDRDLFLFRTQVIMWGGVYSAQT